MRSRLAVLSSDEIQAIQDATLQVLEHVGVDVREPRARRLLERAGATVGPEDERIRIPEGLMKEALRSARKTWTWYARESAKSFRVGEGGPTRLGPGSACTKVIDFATAQARVPTEQDAVAFVRLMDALEFVDINYTPVSTGVHAEAPRYHEVASLVADLTNTSKVPIGPSFNGQVSKDGLEIAAILAGGDEVLRKRPMVAGYCDPVSPLIHDRAMTETLIEYASRGQPIFVTCLALSGASAPASLAGTLVQQNAEILSGLLIATLVNRDAPVIYGCVSGIMDMKTGDAVIGGPEFGLLSVASVQLAHAYHIPCSSGGQSSARIHDARAALEKGTTLLASMLAGADFVDLFFGSYDGFNTTSLEQVVIDHEIAGYARRYAEGIEVDTSRLSLDLIKEVGPGGSYLRDAKSLRDTMSRMRTEWYAPSLFRTGESTGEANPDSLLSTAHERAVRILAEHQVVPLDPQILAEMRAVLTRIHEEDSGKPSSC